MPNILRDLTVDEVSLVDNPANSEIDPLTGRKIPRATVAVWKRDADMHDRAALRAATVAKLRAARRSRLLDIQDRLLLQQGRIDDLKKTFFAGDRDHLHDKVRKGNKKMGFKKIVKSAASRDQIVAAVDEKAQKIAKRNACGLDKARAKVWREHPEAQAAYEGAPVGQPKPPQPQMFQATNAEAQLDTLARKIMKSHDLNYAQACSKALTDDPNIYQRYCDETAANSTVLVPVPVEYSDPFAKRAKAKSGGDEPDGDTCPSCGGDVDADDAYCAQCGTKVKPAKRTA
jgi:hypothetical protein